MDYEVRNNLLESENQLYKSELKARLDKIKELEQENRKLKDKLDAFESSKFNIMALLEIQHPKTAREAENLLQVKKVFERLYNDRLYCLEEENKRLKESLDIATKCSCKEEDGIIRLSEENKMLKEKLSEVTMIADDEKQSIEHILELEEENKRLKEVYDACNLDSINKSFKVANLEMENEKLKEELEWYKKQYEHSMGEN